MFEFFRKLFKPNDCAQLKLRAEFAEQQRDFYREQFKVVTTENVRLVKQREAEIKANRKHDDEVINTITTLASDGKRVALPVPRYSTPPQEIEVEKTPEEKELDEFVKLRVQHFVDDAANRGRTFDVDELILLEENIRRNPEQYY